MLCLSRIVSVGVAGGSVWTIGCFQSVRNYH
jgi:hypothetical protein